MSAVPEDFMREPGDEHDSTRPEILSQQAKEEDARAGWWQWLAIGVLLACWLAEASLCAGQGL
ncbi:MAG TPA: hypothetical protein VFO82_04840 [Steroidobacteraceae bacterium]|nr:hypothetical protein [Steroidobacteraceae bacterium]